MPRTPLTFSFPDVVFATPLSHPALSTYIVLLYQLQIGNATNPVELDRATLGRLTGYSAVLISSGLAGLHDLGLISSSGQSHTMLSPTSQETLPPGRRALEGIPSFTVPCKLITSAPGALHALASLRSSDVRVFLSILSCAGRLRVNHFTVSQKELRQISGLSRDTFRSSLAWLSHLKLCQAVFDGLYVHVHVITGPAQQMII